MYPKLIQSVAANVAEWLVEKRVTHVFGIVGGGNVVLWNEIAKTTQIVCCHHEQAAVMAATSFGRIRGMAVALVTTGAGSTNAITGVMSAWMDSQPVMILSGNEKLATLSAGTRTLGVQGYDSIAVSRQFTKFSARITHARGWNYELERAWLAANTPRKGPVWIDIPSDVQHAIAI